MASASCSWPAKQLAAESLVPSNSGALTGMLQPLEKQTAETSNGWNVTGHSTL